MWKLHNAQVLADWMCHNVQMFPPEATHFKDVSDFGSGNCSEIWKMILKGFLISVTLWMHITVMGLRMEAMQELAVPHCRILLKKTCDFPKCNFIRMKFIPFRLLNGIGRGISCLHFCEVGFALCFWKLPGLHAVICMQFSGVNFHLFALWLHEKCIWVSFLTHMCSKDSYTGLSPAGVFSVRDTLSAGNRLHNGGSMQSCHWHVCGLPISLPALMLLGWADYTPTHSDQITQDPLGDGESLCFHGHLKQDSV